MAIPVEMPKMSDTMEEGVVVAWLAEEGQNISAGDVIAQVETDKATMDLEVYDDGVLLKRVIAEGDAVPIGGLIAILGKAGEDISAILESYASGNGSPVTGSEADPPVEEVVAEPSALATEGRATTGRIKASPLARKLAGNHRIDLTSVQGSGPEGRIIRRDIEALVTGEPATPRTVPSAVPSSPTVSAAAPTTVPNSPTVSVAAPTTVPSSPTVSAAAPAPFRASIPTVVPISAGGYETVRLSQMRKAISRRLSESKFTSPHFYLTVDLAVENMVVAREQINQMTAKKELPKVSFNDLVTKACALALRQHPWVNASYLEAEGEIRLHNDVNVAVAVAVDEGLITPVVRNADRKGLAQIAEETKRLAERARNKELQPEEYSDSTFTTSNLGMFGIEEFTAIINPPNACILAIGAIRDVPVVVGGEVVAGKRMKVTLACDHRVVDGFVGSQFLTTVRTYIENPLTMLL